MMKTVYRTRITTSHISETSLAWEKSVKAQKVRHDSQDPCTRILPAPYSIPPLYKSWLEPGLRD